ILCLLQNRESFFVLVVDDELWNLERTTMRVTNQNDLLTITEVRRVDLTILKRVDRKDHLRASSRKTRSLEMHSRSISTISIFFQKLLLNGRIVKSKDLIEIVLLGLVRQIELLLSQLRALLRKELRRERLRPLVPASFLVHRIAGSHSVR